MAPTKPLHPNAKRIATQAVRDKIRQAIGKKLQKADADDVAQKVYIRLLEMLDRLPDDDDQLHALVFVITEGKVADKLNGTDRADGGHDDASAIERALPPRAVVSPQKRAELLALVAFVREEERAGRIPAGTVPLAIRLTNGESFEDVSADTGVPAATLRSMITRARSHLKANWGKYAGAGTAIFILFLVNHYRDEYPNVGAPNPHADEPEATTSAPANETPARAAERLRREAKSACDARDFAACESRLDAAARLDPTSNARPEVIDLRTLISRARSGAPK